MKPDWNHYPDFQEEEFRCPCCGRNEIKTELLDKLQAARSAAGVPFRITSGYRCPAHNRAVGGVPTSSHTAGYAADIAIPEGSTGFRILKALLTAGFQRIGIAGSFIHADIDPTKPHPTLWIYR